MIEQLEAEIQQLEEGCAELERKIERLDCLDAIQAASDEIGIDYKEASNRLLNHTYRCEFTGEFIIRIGDDFLSVSEAVTLLS